LTKKILLFGLMMFGALSCKADTLEQNFNVGLGIFDAAQAGFVYKETDKSFSINADIYTTNLFDMFYPFSGQYQSKGHFLMNKVVSEIYQTHTKSRNHVRKKKIFYDSYGAPYKRVSIKDEKVNEAAIRNVPESADTADLLSVLVEVINMIRLTQGCELSREIYDDKKHFRVVFKDKGMEKRYFEFTQNMDKGHLCTMHIEHLKNNKDDVLLKIDANNPVKFWFRLDKTTKMPYVMEIRIDSTPLGALKVVPTAVKVK